MAKKTKINAEKNFYDGIQFKSGLELYCYKKLKAAGLAFDYEPESYTLMDGFVFPGTYFKCTNGAKLMVNRSNGKEFPITYKPDFVSNDHKFIIETKGFVPSQHTFTIRWKLFLHWLVINEMTDYKIFLPKNQLQVDQTINIILNDGQDTTVGLLPDVGKSHSKARNRPVRKTTRRKRGPDTRRRAR